DAAPGIVEEWKWNTPVWSCNKNIVAAGAFRDLVKLNFFQGAALSDPHGLFNAGLDAKATRAIDVHQGDVINDAALKELVRAAVALDRHKPKPKTKKSLKKYPRHRCDAKIKTRPPEESNMLPTTQPAAVSKGRLWTGWIMSALPALFLLVDGAMKLVKPEVVVKATVELGY